MYQNEHRFSLCSLYFTLRIKDRFNKVSERARLKTSVSRLVNILFPELEKFVSTIHYKSVYALLSEFPSAKHIAKAHLTRLTNLLYIASKGRHKKDMAIFLREAARNSIASVMPAKSLELKHTIKLIGELTNEISEIEMDDTDRRGRYERMDRGYVERNEQHLSRQEAIAWAQQMENEDGTQGPHWTMDQAKQVMAQKGVECDPQDFWLVLNMMYSDYCKVFRKYDVGDKIDFYVDMAKAFLHDADAQPDKLVLYFDYIVQH